jgi:single-stranded-DNA-specific exonuclease
MQASDGELVGANEGLVAEGVAAGALAEGPGLTLYGTQTRPLPKLLEYAGEVQIPGVTGDEAGAIGFLEDLGIELRADGDGATDDGWRRWVDLSSEERQTVVSGLIRRAVSRGVPADRVNELVGTTYELATETEGTELRDASEFSTLLNATARYDRADVGLAVCLGDRDGALAEARRLLAEHRRNLSEGVSLVEEEGVEQGEHVQWFHAGDRIRETIVGIVAGMAVGADGIDPNRPIVAFADKPDEDAVKVSARATPRLVRRGVDLSTVMTEAAAAVGGEGGGHDVAAGATVPAGAEEGFVEAADAVLADQLE